MAKTKTRRKSARKPLYTKRTADRHELYQIAVQCPEADVTFLNRIYRRAHGKPPVSLMEDFCGTALLCREWVKSRRGRWAVGVDIDASVLEWGRRHNLADLGDRTEQVTLLEQSVTEVLRPKVDLRVAFNFSYSLFTRREDLRHYFSQARKSLEPGGMFVIDLHGGPEAQQDTKEVKPFKGFKYVWEQGDLNPISGLMDCYIHFEFPDGTRMNRAFSYHWRHYGLMELRDILSDAGFSETEVYWEGTDHETGEGDGVYRKTRKADNDPSWIAYIVALP